MKNLLLTIAIIFSNLFAYTQTISGTITDLNTQESLIGVNIILENGNGTASDFSGAYTIKTNAGKQKLTFKYIGYKDIVKEVIVPISGNFELNVKMSIASEELSTVVVSAGKFEQKLEEITVSMEVIKPSLIENKNTTNIQTAVDQIPGVNITDGQANIRGGSGWSYGAGTRVLVMVDDMPLISGDAGQVQWKLIATENINQVEVIKGASSVLYGSSALNGVINIRTAFPSQKDIDKNTEGFVSKILPGYTKVNMHFGLIDFAKRDELNWSGEAINQVGDIKRKRRAFKGIEFLQAMKIKNLDFSIGGNIFQDDGYRLGEITDRKRININTTYKDKKIEGLSYGINANFLSQESGSVLIWKSLDEAYIPLGREVTTTTGDTYNIDPFVTFIKGKNKHSIRTRFLKVVNNNKTNGIDVGQSNESETYYSDYQWQRNFGNGLRFTTGMTNKFVSAQADLFNGNNIIENHSFYGQLDKKYGRINMSAGARYEHFSVRTGQLYLIDDEYTDNITTGKPVFRTGINYQLAEATFLRSSWGQGYRFPSMAELFISTNQSGLEIYPNPELKPESGWSSEIGLKQGFRVGNWKGYADLAAFLMQYNDMMEFTFGKWAESIYEIPNNPFSGTTNYNGIGFKSLNVGATQINGIELSITGQGKINKNTVVNILGGYTYMDSKIICPDCEYAEYVLDSIQVASGMEGYATYANSSSDSTISVLKYRYKNIAKIDIEIKHKKISLGYSARYNDFMKNIDYIFAQDLIESQFGIYGINDAREKFKNGDLIMDARLGYQYNDNLRFGIIVNNILNIEYMSRPANMMPPRTYAIQLSAKI